MAVTTVSSTVQNAGLGAEKLSSGCVLRCVNRAYSISFTVCQSQSIIDNYSFITSSCPRATDILTEYLTAVTLTVLFVTVMCSISDTCIQLKVEFS